MGGPGSRLAIAAVFFVLVAIWGSTWAAIRIGLAGIPPFTGVALRFGLAAAVLYGVARLFGIRLGGGRRVRFLWAVQTVFAFALSYGVVYWAEQWVPSGLAAVLFATFPLFVALLASAWLERERLTPGGAVGLLVGFGGIGVIFSEDLARLGGRQVLLASAVMLVSPLAAAVSHVAVKRWGSGIHPLNLTAPPMAATAVLMGAVAVVVERQRELRFDAVSVGALLYLAILGSAVTFTLYYWLLERLAATRVALITYGIPLVALGIGAAFLDEPLTVKTVGGAAFVIGGVALADRGLQGRR